MKIKRSIKVVLIISIIGLICGGLYFKFALPFLNLMSNDLAAEPSTVDPVYIDGTIIKPANTSDPNATNTITTTYPPLPSGSTNILLIGADAAAGLTDTMIIANIDQNSKVIKLISLPRDAYVQYSDTIYNAIKSEWGNSPGLHKLNNAASVGTYVLNYQGGDFPNQGISFLCDTIEACFGYHIDDYIRVNFDGFIEMVDLFGGVYVYSDETIRESNGAVVVPQGWSTLNSYQALYYARARYRYDENGKNLPSPGDAYRKKHQLTMIVNMCEQVVTVQNILNADRILNGLSKNVFHSISTEDLSSYLSVATDYSKDKYTVKMTLINGPTIDPFGDGCSYVSIAPNDVTFSEVEGLW